MCCVQFLAGRCYWWGLIFINLNPTSTSGASVAAGGVAAGHMTLPGLAADVATDPHQAFVRKMLRGKMPVSSVCVRRVDVVEVV
jgi:hypothetical protein